MFFHNGRREPQAPFAIEAEYSADQGVFSVPSLLWHLLSDVLPQIAEHRHFSARDVVSDRYARQFHNATFDRVHEGEITHRPGEQRPFGITGTAQKERCRGKVDDTRHPTFRALRDYFRFARYSGTIARGAEISSRLQFAGRRFVAIQLPDRRESRG